MGDYCSGTNHVLPTFGYARSYSGVSLLEFQKRITVQELSADGLRALGPTADHAFGPRRTGCTRQCGARAAGRARGERWRIMSDILALARPDIVALKAYSHASWDPSFDRLHANELPWRAETDRSLAGLNRYPEPHPHELAARLAALYGVEVAQLLPGRGSDESIDLLVRGFCRAGLDNVIICPPTFGMYAVAARIQGAEVREVPLQRERGFALDVARRARGLRREYAHRLPVHAQQSHRQCARASRHRSAC